MMNGYFGYDDLVVPKDQGYSDGFQSPDSWSNWGLNDSNTFNDYPHKHMLSPTNLNPEQLRFDSQTSPNHQFDMECSTIPDRDQSSCSSFGGRAPVYHQSLHRQAADSQLDCLSGFEPMDDHFLSSLLDDMQEMEQNSPCFSSESQDCMIPADDLWTEATALDSDSISSNGGFAASSHYSPCDLEKAVLHQLKVPPFTVSVTTSEDDCKDFQLQNEPSREESALHEFELMMAQLPTKTRICFRDALYRLAKNSRPHEVASDDVSMDTSSWAPQVEESRSGERGMEPETNSIDRSIASMMFNQMDLNVLQSNHPQCFTPAPHSPTFLGDAEVPVSGNGGYIGGAAAADSDMHMSRTVAN
ncbi:unnamed protein product [Linum tenue]|uniref:Uncharacterized protein n=1 Tax=Linum tenue TaxID=586396 RepID=A0AAV0KKU4_9ROSI|nr:unnamed protein product [Linum tenue]